jgi:hypothetical protein
MASRTSLLGIPLELRIKIYKEVFVGSEIKMRPLGCMQDDNMGYINSLQPPRYVGPENYNVLLICSRINKEARHCLFDSIEFCLDNACDSGNGFRITFFDICQGVSAPGLLRQAMPHIKRIKMRDLNAIHFEGDLSVFPKLEELLLSGGLKSDLQVFDGSEFPSDEFRKVPFLILGSAHDRILLNDIIQLFRDDNNQLPTRLDSAKSKDRHYRVIMESHFVLYRPPSVYEPAYRFAWDLIEDPPAICMVGALTTLSFKLD